MTYTITKLWNHEKYGGLLLNLLYKSGFRHMFTTINVLAEYLEKLIDGNRDDDKIYRRLRQLCENQGTEVMPEDDYKRARIARANLRWKEINNIYSLNEYDYERYLDFGCGDCSMAYLLGSKMRLKRSNIHAVDIEGWEGNIDEYDIYRPKCQFISYDGNTLPYQDGTFDIVTVFQVLHHVRNLQQILDELHRVMMDGGILIIREHHCHNDKMRHLIQIEHQLHNKVFTKTISDGDEFSQYRPMKELRKLIKKTGFLWQGKYKEADPNWNPTNYYYEIYVRIAI